MKNIQKPVLDQEKKITLLKIKLAKHVKEESIDDFVKKAKDLSQEYSETIKENGYSKDAYKYYKKKMNVLVVGTISSQINTGMPQQSIVSFGKIGSTLLDIAIDVGLFALLKKMPIRLRSVRNALRIAAPIARHMAGWISPLYKVHSIKSILKKEGMEITKLKSIKGNKEIKKRK